MNFFDCQMIYPSQLELNIETNNKMSCVSSQGRRKIKNFMKLLSESFFNIREVEK